MPSRSSSYDLNTVLPATHTKVLLDTKVEPIQQDEPAPDRATKAIIKRMKNTQAARESRKRKVEHMRQIETRVKDIEDHNKDLERENAVLKTENNGQSKRITALERQVEELHSVLMAFGCLKNQTEKAQRNEKSDDYSDSVDTKGKRKRK
jgi:predicted RNase H-like nuclease (RuvC/YqgF family)